MNQKQNIKLTALDRRILNRLQEDIPFVERPWRAIGLELNISEGFLLKKIAFLKKEGIIRRISAVFTPARIGFVSTLIAIKVAAANIDRLAKKINSYPEVTHNYRRAAEYNLWFTLVASNSKRIAQIKNQIKQDKDVRGLLDFPSLKLFKINVKLNA